MKARLLGLARLLASSIGLVLEARRRQQLAGAVDPLDAQRSAARALVGEAIEERARTAIEADIPGSRYRNVHVACFVESLTTERIALPAWVLAYRFRGAPYRAIVHGQRHTVVVGTSPIDWNKVARLAAVVLAIAAVALYLYLRYGR
jgi:hypothetical protein